MPRPQTPPPSLLIDHTDAINHVPDVIRDGDRLTVTSKVPAVKVIDSDEGATEETTVYIHAEWELFDDGSTDTRLWVQH